MRIIKTLRILLKIFGILFALFYMFINVSWYDKRSKLAMVYRNFDGDFIKAELFVQGHGTYSDIIQDFDDYKHTNNKPNEKLYRTFKLYWTDWGYHLEYIIHPRWKLEYRPYIIQNDSKE